MKNKATIIMASAIVAILLTATVANQAFALPNALNQNEQLTNNINSQHTLDNKPINNGPPQSSFGYFFTHSR